MTPAASSSVRSPQMFGCGAETAGCPDSQRWCTGVGDAPHFLLLEFDGLAAGDSQSISANTLEKNVEIILTGDKSTHVCS